MSECEFCSGSHSVVDQVGCVLARAEGGEELSRDDVIWLCYEVGEMEDAYSRLVEETEHYREGISAYRRLVSTAVRNGAVKMSLVPGQRKSVVAWEAQDSLLRARGEGWRDGV